jgi:hypothetical protein
MRVKEPKSARRAQYKGILAKPSKFDDDIIENHQNWHMLSKRERNAYARKVDAFINTRIDALARHFGIDKNKPDAARELIWTLAKKLRIPAFVDDAKPRGAKQRRPRATLLADVRRLQSECGIGLRKACAKLAGTPGYENYDRGDPKGTLYGRYKKMRKIPREVEESESSRTWLFDLT